MTEADQRLLVEQATWIGPVVDAARALLETMRPLPLCVVCPSAQWYGIEDEKARSASKPSARSSAARYTITASVR